MGTFFINFASDMDMMKQILGSVTQLIGGEGGNGALAGLLGGNGAGSLDFASIAGVLQGLDPTTLTTLAGDQSGLSSILQGLGISL
jgi:hypothetical protein